MVTTCRICFASFSPFVSFGRMPFANGFLTPDKFADEYWFELAVGFCTRCGMVQLVEQPDRERMFHDQYAFYSSTSRHMARHFAELASLLRSQYMEEQNPFIVELGSNDGILLRHFVSKYVRHLGVEPSANVAAVAREQGVQTISEFFDEDLAERIRKEYGAADVVVAANTMCHIADINSVAAGIAALLKPRGVLVFEDPYLGDIVEKTSYDQIYDEHVFYFSLSSVEYLFGQHGLELVDVQPQSVHGGSMRYVFARRDTRSAHPHVAQHRAAEHAMGLTEIKTFERLRENIERSRDDLRHLLADIREAGKRVVGYGATSKSTTVLNFCSITPEDIEFISDTTPIKQGKYSPGAHIPIRPHEEFVQRYPDYALLFAWNHGQEIMDKELAFLQAGGKWILFVPKVHVQQSSLAPTQKQTI